MWCSLKKRIHNRNIQVCSSNSVDDSAIKSIKNVAQNWGKSVKAMEWNISRQKLLLFTKTMFVIRKATLKVTGHPNIVEKIKDKEAFFFSLDSEDSKIGIHYWFVLGVSFLHILAFHGLPPVPFYPYSFNLSMFSFRCVNQSLRYCLFSLSRHRKIKMQTIQYRKSRTSQMKEDE